MRLKNLINPQKILLYVLIWRLRHVSNRQFMMFLSILVGIASGLGAVAIKNSVHFISFLVQDIIHADGLGYIYLYSPIVGIFFTVLYIKYLLKLSKTTT
jgi:CIC family chloride channel protein